MQERKDQNDLTGQEWTDFTEAVKALQDVAASTPNYAAIAKIHTPFHHQRTAHRLPTFLPWHREYLWTFEQRLQEINASVTLPYWNWTNQRKLPAPLSSAKEWGVLRGMGAKDRVGDYSSDVTDAMNKIDYEAFHWALSPAHGNIHMDVGGQMGEIMRSPEDVIFWLHHAYLDKLWADWQKTNAGAEPDMPARLLPEAYFMHTGNQVLKTQDLGYLYV